MEEHKEKNKSELITLRTYEEEVYDKIITLSVQGNIEAIALYEAKKKEKEFNNIINEMDDDEFHI